MKKYGLRIILAILIVALIAVVTVILLRMREYKQSEDFYHGLRSALLWRNV